MHLSMWERSLQFHAWRRSYPMGHTACANNDDLFWVQTESQAAITSKGAFKKFMQIPRQFPWYFARFHCWIHADSLEIQDTNWIKKIKTRIESLQHKRSRNDEYYQVKTQNVKPKARRCTWEISGLVHYRLECLFLFSLRAQIGGSRTSTAADWNSPVGPLSRCVNS